MRGTSAERIPHHHVYRRNRHHRTSRRRCGTGRARCAGEGPLEEGRQPEEGCAQGPERGQGQGQDRPERTQAQVVGLFEWTHYRKLNRIGGRLFPRSRDRGPIEALCSKMRPRRRSWTSCRASRRWSCNISATARTAWIEHLTPYERLHRHSQLDAVVRRVYQVLFCPEIPFRRLNGCVPEEQLNLLQFAARRPTHFRAATPQIVRGDSGVPGIAPHDCRRTAAKLCRAAGGELEQIQLLLGHASVQTTERYLGTKQDLVHAPNDGIKLKVAV